MTAALPAASRCESEACSAVAAVTAPEGEAAEQAVEPHPHAAAREALAAEQDDARVEAEVGAEPQRIAPRGHGRQAVVADVVDEPAAAVQQDPERRGTARWRARPAPRRRGPGTGRRRRRRRCTKMQLPGQAGGARGPAWSARRWRRARPRRARTVATSARRAPERQRLRGSVGGHGRVVGAPMRQVESRLTPVFTALRLRRGPRRWRPPGSACWRRACPWRCGRARGPWRARCPGARRPPRPCCRRRAARRPGARAARGRPCRRCWWPLPLPLPLRLARRSPLRREARVAASASALRRAVTSSSEVSTERPMGRADTRTQRMPPSGRGRPMTRGRCGRPVRSASAPGQRSGSASPDSDRHSQGVGSSERPRSSSRSTPSNSPAARLA